MQKKDATFQKHATYQFFARVKVIQSRNEVRNNMKIMQLKTIFTCFSSAPFCVVLVFTTFPTVCVANIR